MTSRAWVLMFAIAALWGASFLFIKLALGGVPTGSIGSLRSMAGAMTILVMLAAAGRSRARAVLSEVRRRPMSAIATGGLAFSVPVFLVAVAEHTVPSGTAGLVMASSPLFVAASARLVDRSEQVSVGRAVGLVIGLAGVALVVGVSAGTRTSEWPGLVAVLGGALANAAGSYGLRWRYAETPALEGAFAVVAGSAVASLPLLLISFPPNLPGTRAAVGLLGLGTLSTGIAVVLYVSLVQRCGNGRATLVNYLLPAFALLYASIFLSEAVTVTDLAGFGLIAIGVLVAAGSAAAAGAVLPIGIDRGVKIRRSR